MLADALRPEVIAVVDGRRRGRRGVRGAALRPPVLHRLDARRDAASMRAAAREPHAGHARARRQVAGDRRRRRGPRRAARRRHRWSASCSTPARPASRRTTRWCRARERRRLRRGGRARRRARPLSRASRQSDYTAIVNDRHHARLAASSTTPARGATVDRRSGGEASHVTRASCAADARPRRRTTRCAVMQEEIFGPICRS